MKTTPEQSIRLQVEAARTQALLAVWAYDHALGSAVMIPGDQPGPERLDSADCRSVRYSLLEVMSSLERPLKWLPSVPPIPSSQEPF